MSNSRAIHLNGKWVEIKKCWDCSGCEVSADYMWCYELVSLYNYDTDNPVAIIDDCGKILSNCPRPLWDRVRWHTADEVKDIKDKDCYLEVIQQINGRVQPPRINEASYIVSRFSDDCFDDRHGVYLLKWRYIL